MVPCSSHQVAGGNPGLNLNNLEFGQFHMRPFFKRLKGDRYFSCLSKICSSYLQSSLAIIIKC